MTRTRRRTRAAVIESSDEDETCRWSKRLKPTTNQNDQPTTENQQSRLSPKTGESRNKKKKFGKGSKRKLQKRNVNLRKTYDLSSTDDEKELFPQAKPSDYWSDTGSDGEVGKASSSFASSSINVASKTLEPKSDGTVSDSSIESFFVNQEKEKLASTSKDLLASDEDEVITCSRRRSMRPLSDYETGDSSERGHNSSLNFYSVNSVTPPEHEDIDSFSENDVMIRPTCRSNRRSLILTTSDSSDSEVVKPQGLKKQRRIASSSEDSDSDNGSSREFSWGSTRAIQRQESSDRNHINQTQQNTRQLRSRRNNPISELDPTEAQLSPENNNQRTSSRVRSRRVLQNRRRQRVNYNTRRSSSHADSISPVSSDIGSDSDWALRSFTITMENFLDRSSSSGGVGSRTLRSRIVPRVVSSGSESDISLPNSSTRRRGALVTICESDEDAPHCSSIVPTSRIHFSPIRQSSDSDGESEKCPICFSRFVTQEIGSPASCEHSFCIVCIEEWAKNSNTCPIDRKVFDRIMVRSCTGGELLREVQVQRPTANFWEGGFLDEVTGLVMEIEDEFVSDFVDEEGPEELCCVCRDGSQTDNLVVCDLCDAVYHMSCLDPPLRSIPVDNWFCPRCTFDDFDLDIVLSSSSD